MEEPVTTAALPVGSAHDVDHNDDVIVFIPGTGNYILVSKETGETVTLTPVQIALLTKRCLGRTSGTRSERAQLSLQLAHAFNVAKDTSYAVRAALDAHDIGSSDWDTFRESVEQAIAYLERNRHALFDPTHPTSPEEPARA